MRNCSSAVQVCQRHTCTVASALSVAEKNGQATDTRWVLTYQNLLLSSSKICSPFTMNKKMNWTTESEWHLAVKVNLLEHKHFLSCTGHQALVYTRSSRLISVSSLLLLLLAQAFDGGVGGGGMNAEHTALRTLWTTFLKPNTYLCLCARKCALL